MKIIKLQTPPPPLPLMGGDTVRLAGKFFHMFRIIPAPDAGVGWKFLKIIKLQTMLLPLYGQA